MNKLISLTQGFFAIVDEQDYESLSQFKWTVKINPTNTYAYRKDGGKTIHMHRVVLEAKHEEICDHINGNGIDNRRKNLRLCTMSQNMANSKLGAQNTSGYKGLLRRNGRWVARICFKTNGKKNSKWLGTFNTKRDAAIAYNTALRKIHGSYARLNKI